MTMDNNSLDLKGVIVLNIGRNKKLVRNTNGSFAQHGNARCRNDG